MIELTEAQKQAQRDAWDRTDRRHAENASLRQLITLCAWCKRYLHGSGDSNIAVSHGICQPCADAMIKQAAEVKP